MNRKSAGENFSQNLFNLIFISVVLMFITACVCQSDRNNPAQENTAPKATPASSNSPTATNDKKDKNKNEDRGDFLVNHFAVQNSKYDEIDRVLKHKDVVPQELETEQ